MIQREERYTDRDRVSVEEFQEEVARVERKRRQISMAVHLAAATFALVAFAAIAGAVTVARLNAIEPTPRGAYLAIGFGCGLVSFIIARVILLAVQPDYPRPPSSRGRRAE